MQTFYHHNVHWIGGIKHIAVTTVSTFVCCINFSAQINTNLWMELQVTDLRHENVQFSRAEKWEIHTQTLWMGHSLWISMRMRRQIDKFYLLFASVFRHWTFVVNWPVNWIWAIQNLQPMQTIDLVLALHPYRCLLLFCRKYRLLDRTLTLAIYYGYVAKNDFQCANSVRWAEYLKWNN